MKYIKKILAYIKSQNTSVTEAAPVSCNYNDNYYGDQCCASKQVITQASYQAATQTLMTAVK